jgi:hypothetical protein
MIEFAAVILGLVGLLVVLKCLPPTKAARWNKRMHEIDVELLQKAAQKMKKPDEITPENYRESKNWFADLLANRW